MTELEKKQDELIAYLFNEPNRKTRPNAYDTWKDRVKKLKSEIAALKQGEPVSEKPYSKGKRIQGDGDIDYYQDEDGSVNYA